VRVAVESIEPVERYPGAVAELLGERRLGPWHKATKDALGAGGLGVGRACLPGSSLGVCKFRACVLAGRCLFLSSSQFASSVALRSSFQAPSLEAATAYLIPGIRGSG